MMQHFILQSTEMMSLKLFVAVLFVAVAASAQKPLSYNGWNFYPSNRNPPQLHGPSSTAWYGQQQNLDVYSGASKQDDDDSYRSCRKRGFTCKRGAKDMCYCISRSPTNAYEAKERCWHKGMQLVSIHSPEQQDALASFLALVTKVGQNTWTSGTTSRILLVAPVDTSLTVPANGVQWCWNPYVPESNERNWRPIFFQNWAPDQPVLNTDTSCLIVNTTPPETPTVSYKSARGRRDRFGWHSVDCNDSYQFVCTYRGRKDRQ